MITRHSTTALRILRSYWPRVLAVMAIVVLVEIANDYVHLEKRVFSISAVALLVTALSIFLIFRVNEAYARWWEARTLWGCIVNSSRSFARQATTLIGSESGNEAAQREVESLRTELVYRQIAWVNALRLTLRGQDDWDALRPFLSTEELESIEDAASKPNQILQTQGARLSAAHAAGYLSEFSRLVLDRTLAELHDTQGGCERIKNTPFPDRVSYFTRIVAWGLAILIPLGLTDSTNRFDLIDMVVVPFMMLAFVLTERLGAELKNPFEGLENDTPMTALCRSIEIDLRQQLGEQEVPPPLEPENGVLM